MAATEEQVRADLAQADDLAPSYLEHRVQLAQQTAAQELLGRVSARRAAEGADAAGEADQAAITDDAVSRGQIPRQRTGPGQAAGGGTAARVVRDVALGTVETPRAIAAGLRDAVQSTIHLTEELGNYLESKLPLGGVQLVDEQGRFNFRYLSPEELKERGVSGIELPEIASPRSTTGRMVKGIAQFVAGFAGAGKFKALERLRTVGRAAARGAIADFTVFEPHEQRLSNLIEEFPALRNPVTDYLAADPDDSAAEGRFKNALEGLSLGLLADGFAASVRALRQWRLTKQTATDALDAGAPRQLPDTAFDALGDPDLPAVAGRSDLARRMTEATEATGDTPAAALADVPEGEVFINFARIDTPEDVQSVMQNMADRFRGDVDAARRGVRSFKDIELGAEQVDAWQTLMARRVGEPLNAEQSLAARRLWVTSAEKLTSVAKAAAENPSEANLFAFRKMLSVHYAIQREVIGARTETARALAQWRIPAGGSAERMRDIEAVLQTAGGADVSRELAQRIAKLSNPALAKDLDAVVEKGVYARTRDAVIEAWIMGLLSGPKTHLVNMISNSAVVGMQVYERGVAAQISRLLGEEGGVAVGEAAAQWFGMVEGLKDALRFVGKSTMYSIEHGLIEEGLPNPQFAQTFGKVDAPQIGAISSEALGLSSSTWIGRAVDGVGNLIRVPGRALGAADEFFKTVGYRMEVHAQALRQARSEVLAGKIEPDQLKARVQEIVENPPENIRLASVDQALYQTFTNKTGDFAGSLSKLAYNYPAVRVLLPFIRTPANIMRYTFERTPLAPLMADIRADVAAGGPRRDLALARMATGTTILLAAADLTMNGQISGGGPASQNERAALVRSGWQPYSAKIGDTWYAYNRLDPVGMMLGIAADMVEILANNDEWTQGAGPDEVAIAAAAAIGNNVMSKTYLSGVAEFFEAMADPRRSSENYAQRLAGSLVPTGVAEARRIEDPYMREVRSMLDAIKNRTPGLSEGLPVNRDLWGRPRSYRSPMGIAYDMFSPIYAREDDPEPIDSEILSGGAYSRARAERRGWSDEDARGAAPFNVSMPGRQTSFNGATIDLDKYPGAYSRYLELAGNELKHPAWGMGAKDYLNAVVSGRHPMSEVYAIRSDGPDGGKEVFIRDTINDYRERARAQLLEEYPDLRREVEEKQARRRELRLPVTN